MPRPDAPDLAVDELRRKARRRLVGAVVLALAAAVLLPLLLENEPKPLGDDVSIRIPPVDTGKFVNPLSPASAPDTKAKSEKPSVESAPAPPPAQARRANDSAKTEPPKAEPAQAESAKAESAKLEPAPSASPSSAPLATTPTVPASKSSESQPGDVVTKSPASSSPATKTDAKSSAGESRSETSKTGVYVVQVAAFSDRFGARTLVAKLKQGGFPGYTETVTTDRGTLHRVRVGPYASREVADAARAKLKAAGFAGVVARNG
jgi:DedD protein